METNSSVPIPLRGALLRVATLELPPKTLSPGKTYLVELHVTAENSLTSVARQTVTAVAPSPILSILGGNRDIPASATLELEVTIVDPEYQPGAITWACCPSNIEGEACLVGQQCPSLLAAIVNIRSQQVAITAPNSGLPAGTYFFTARYKSQVTSTLLSIRAADIPLCTLSLDSPVVYSNQIIFVHGLISFNSQTTSKWSLNGTILSTAGSASLLTIPANTLPALSQTTVALSVTTNTDQMSQCRITITPREAPTQGRCVVQNDDPSNTADFRSNLATASASWIGVWALGWSSSIQLKYRPGYYDVSSNPVLLSSAYTSAPFFRTIAPVILNNPSLITVKFFVEIVAQDDELTILGRAQCLVDLKSVADRSTYSLFDALLARLAIANASANFDSSLELASRISTLLDDADVPIERRKAAATQILQICRRISSNTEALALCAVRRSVIIDLLVRIVGKLNATASSTVMVQDTVLALLSLRDGVVFDYVRDIENVKTLIQWAISGEKTATVVQLVASTMASRVNLGSSAAATLSTQQFMIDIKAYHIGATVFSSQEWGSSSASVSVSTSVVTAALQERKLEAASTAQSYHSTPVSVATSAESFQLMMIATQGLPTDTQDGLVVVPQATMAPVGGTAVSVTFGPAARVQAPLVSVAVRYAFRVARPAEYDPLDYNTSFWSSLTDATVIHFDTTVTTNFTSVSIFHRNLTCFVFADGTWKALGPAVLSLSAAAFDDPATVYRDPRVTCAVKSNAALIGVFDTSFMDPITFPPTPAPKKSITSAISDLTSSLSTGAIVAIAIGVVGAIAGVGLVFFLKRHKARGKKDADKVQSKSQILMLSELLKEDDDLRLALDLAKIRNTYLADL